MLTDFPYKDSVRHSSDRFLFLGFFFFAYLDLFDRYQGH